MTYDDVSITPTSEKASPGQVSRLTYLQIFPIGCEWLGSGTQALEAEAEGLETKLCLEPAGGHCVGTTQLSNFCIPHCEN